MANCQACKLSSKTKNCVSGFGNPNAPLSIILPAPDSRAEQLLVWLILSMSLKSTDVYVDYIFKCPIPKVNNPVSKKVDRVEAMKICLNKWDRPGFVAQQIVTLGDIPYEAYSDVSKAGKFQGRHDPKLGIWVGYSLMYALMSPGESMRLWRLIYKAAEAAGLKPSYDAEFPKFEFPKR